MSLLENLPHECTIRKKTYTQDSLGAKVVSNVDLQTAVKCWEQPASDSEVDLFQKQGMRITHKVYFTSDPSVSRRHQILITKRQGTTVSSPVSLDVVSVSQPDVFAGLQGLWKVLCEEVTSEKH